MLYASYYHSAPTFLIRRWRWIKDQFPSHCLEPQWNSRMLTGCLIIHFDDSQITHSILLQSKRPNQAGFSPNIALAYLGVRGMQGASKWFSEKFICALLTVHSHFFNISIEISTLLISRTWTKLPLSIGDSRLMPKLCVDLLVAGCNPTQR